MDEAALANCSTTCVRGRRPTTRSRRLRRLPFADLGFARVDHHRALRQGCPRPSTGLARRPNSVAAIVGELLGRRPTVRSSSPGRMPARSMRRWAGTPAGTRTVTGSGNRRDRSTRRAGRSSSGGRPPAIGVRVLVVTAGTADLPVAERVRGDARRPRVAPDADWRTAAWPGCTVCWPRSTSSRRRCGRRGRGDGGRAGQRGRRDRAGPGRGRPDQRRLRAALEGVTALLAMLASCAAGMRGRGSTTDSARPVRSPACCP